MFSGLNEKDPHRLICMNVGWNSLGRVQRSGLVGGVLLGSVDFVIPTV